MLKIYPHYFTFPEHHIVQGGFDHFGIAKVAAFKFTFGKPGMAQVAAG